MTVNTLNSRSFSRSVQALGLVAGTMIGTVCLSLGTIGQAQAFTFSEPPDAGALITGAPGLLAADTTGLGPVGLSSTITGTLTPNDRDLFKILINSAGIFSASTQGGGNPPGAPGPIVDANLYLFSSLGSLLASDATSGQASITQALGAGSYYLGIVKDGISPRLNSNIFAGWKGEDVENSRNPNVSTYQINLGHKTNAVPTPALLPGLVGMGLSIWRKRKEEALV
jgi:hypothetical protein